MEAWVALTKFEAKLFFRNIINVIFLLIFPSMMLLIFGGIYGNEPTEIYSGYGTIDMSVPAYIAMVISVTGIMNLPLVICEYRDKKILRRFRATPLNPIHIIFAQLFVNLVMTVFGMVVLIVVGKLVFNLHYWGNIGFTILFFVLSVVSIFSIGLLIASVSPSVRAATAIANIVFFPMLFLSGASIPLELMPKTMNIISKFLPLTYVVDGMKKVWLGQQFSTVLMDIVILLAISIACLVISFKTFKWE